MRKRAHVPLWQKCLVGITAAVTIIAFAWFHTSYRITRMIETAQLQTDRANLTEQRDWYSDHYHDRPPVVDVFGAWP